MKHNTDLHAEAIELLKQLISIPSPSGSEEGTADVLTAFLDEAGITYQRNDNNVSARNVHWDVAKPVIVLNSHHDTIKPNQSWKRDPFHPHQEHGKLFGLGSNDAGGSLVSLIAAFRHFYERDDLPWNLLLLATAEEENSGPRGVSKLLAEIDIPIDLAIVGEPTSMKVAIAEKGLLVIDGLAMGRSGHAAFATGQNAIEKAVRDIRALLSLEFARVSEVLGPVMLSVTQIEGGYQHNVIPDHCSFVVDVRVNEMYSLQEIVNILQQRCESRLMPRSLRNRPSKIAPDHPAVKAAKAIGLKTYGSPTLSDQVHFACPSIKVGCGKSERSHQADEYIELQEIRKGIDTYIRLLEQLTTQTIPRFQDKSVPV